MKIKSLILSAILFPASIFAATNSFDNITVKTSAYLNGNNVATNGVDGSVTNYFSAINVYARKTDDVFMSFIATNGTRVGGISWDGASGFSIGTPSVQMQFAESTGQLNLFAGNYQIDSNGALFTANLTVTGTLAAQSNTTFGSFAGNTMTINGSTVTAPNTLNINSSTLWITNGSVAVNTNSAAAAAAFTVQANAITQVPLTLRAASGQTAAMAEIRSSANAILFRIDSAGSITAISGTTLASLSSANLNLLNNGGVANVINNTASANSTLNLGGGTGIGSQVTLSASGIIIASFSTNRIALNRPVIIGTNGMAIDAVLIKKVTYDAPSIAATATFTTNIALLGARTDSMANAIIGTSPTAGIVYQANVPSNDFANISMVNITALPVDPANQTVGVSVFNDSIAVTP